MSEYSKAEDIRLLKGSVNTEEQHSIDCCICGASEDYAAVSLSAALEDLYKTGWRSGVSDKYQVSGAMCPACFAQPDAERGGGSRLNEPLKIDLDNPVYVNAKVIGDAAQAAVSRGEGVSEVVEKIVSDLVGHAWVDTPLEHAMLRDLGSLFDLPVVGSDDEDEELLNE